MMKKAAFLVLALVCLALVAAYVGGRDKAQPDAPVDVEVQRRDFQVEVNVVGELDDAQSHMLSSEIQGTDGKIIYLIEDGTRVKKGDTLVRLDPLPYQTQVEGLQAEVAELKAAVEAARQMMAYEENQVRQEIAGAEYNLNVATLELR